MTIHDDAWEGSLDTIKLKGYLEADKELINELHDGKGITPLAGATIKGHVTVVENLLQSKADPNKPSRTGETALVFAATRTTKNRAQIIRLLLGYGADPNITCAHRDGNTPLMLVILYRKDIEAITQLVDAKASLTVTNRDGKTATDLADKTNDPRVIEALLPKEQRAWRLAVVVDLITSLIKFILAWVNNPTISGAVKGTVKRLYNMDVPVDREIEQRVNVTEPQTMEDFKNNVWRYVDDTELNKFFNKKDHPFLQTVAEKAVALKDDPTTLLGDLENLPKVLQVSMYQSVIYCDDSGSMRYGTLWADLKEVVDRIARITTVLIPDDQGVELRFINNEEHGSSNLRQEHIREKMNKFKPVAGQQTEIGYNLKRKILQPLIYDKIQRDGSLERPLLISIITDGAPEGDLEKNNDFIKAINECGDFLDKQFKYPRTAVKFQVSQIGSSGAAVKFLGDLKEEDRIRDVVHCTADRLDDKFKELRDSEGRLEKWLLTTLMESVTKRSSD